MFVIWMFVLKQRLNGCLTKCDTMVGTHFKIIHEQRKSGYALGVGPESPILLKIAS